MYLSFTTSTHSEVNIKDRENLSAIVLTDIVIWVAIVMATVILTKNDDNVSPNKQTNKFTCVCIETTLGWFISVDHECFFFYIIKCCDRFHLHEKKCLHWLLLQLV